MIFSLNVLIMLLDFSVVNMSRGFSMELPFKDSIELTDGEYLISFIASSPS
jgi:hypothetical protein